MWVSRILSVMPFFAGTRVALPSSLTSVRISGWAYSGKSRATSSVESREKSPRSTHCRAATVVKSLVHDAIQKVESKVRGGASGWAPALPNALA